MSIKRVLYSVISCLLFASSAPAQFRSHSEVPVIGDTLFLVKTKPNLGTYLTGGTEDCECTDESNVRTTHSVHIIDSSVFYIPTTSTLDTVIVIDFVDCYRAHPGPHNTCASFGHVFIDTIYLSTLADSLPRIRPLPPRNEFDPTGWRITMRPDSMGTVWSDRANPTFSNGLSDTAIFSNFTAIGSNGGSCELLVENGGAPLSRYAEPPHVNKAPLTFVFSSKAYHAFDTLLANVRVQYQSVDSIVSYAIPVFWLPYSSVTTVIPETTGVVEVTNPFSSALNFNISLANASSIALKIFDVSGSELKSLVLPCNAGKNEIKIDGGAWAEGVYLYELHSLGWTSRGKLVKLKK